MRLSKKNGGDFILIDEKANPVNIYLYQNDIRDVVLVLVLLPLNILHTHFCSASFGDFEKAKVSWE